MFLLLSTLLFIDFSLWFVPGRAHASSSFFPFSSFVSKVLYPPYPMLPKEKQWALPNCMPQFVQYVHLLLFVHIFASKVLAQLPLYCFCLGLVRSPLSYLICHWCFWYLILKTGSFCLNTATEPLTPCLTSTGEKQNQNTYHLLVEWGNMGSSDNKVESTCSTCSLLPDKALMGYATPHYVLHLTH